MAQSAAIIKLLAICFLAYTARAQSPKPNIVFIMADDLGFNDVSYHGHGDIPTPNIDILADAGVKLENYYVAPSCGPTRSQFLSGKYSIHLGLHDSNLDVCTKDAVPTNIPTIADKMKEQGYATHLIGKWHAGFHTQAHLPTNRGFDTFRGLLLSHGDHLKHDARHVASGVKYLDYHNNTDRYDGDFGVYSTTAFTNRATELIGNHNKNTPMFMYLSYQAPHSPIEAPPGTAVDPSIGSPDRQQYAAMVTQMDAAIGEVVQALKDAQMDDNTVIIFSSDNGGPMNNGASNFPLTGQKGSLYQGGVRAVGFVNSPLIAETQRGKEVTDLIHVTDWLPTFLGIAGSNADGLTIDGLDQWNTIKTGATGSRTEVLLNIREKRRGGMRIPFDDSITAALIDGDFKILTGSQLTYYAYANPGDDYTIFEDERANVGRSITTDIKLFNLADDPSEQTNLANIDTGKRDDLLIKLRAYQRTMLPAIKDEKDSDACDPSKNGGFWQPWL